MEEDTPSPKQPNSDLKEIRQIVDLMEQKIARSMVENDLSYFHLQRGSTKIEIRRGSDMEAAKDLLSKISLHAPFMGAAPLHTPAPAPLTTGPHSSPGTQPPAESHGPTINSPMVGTFYRASGPGEKAFVNVGDVVDENSVVCIIEAMKVLNEIKAEARGTIVRILVDDAKPVQYGQPLFELK